MVKYIQKLSPRKLSVLGKAILVNTLILAKTTYLNNIFPIPENQIKQIHIYIFTYLWQNKTPEPISRKTLFLTKQQGGLNIKELEAHNMSVRLKHLLNLKQKEKNPPWMHIEIYWIGKDIYNYNYYYHLKNSNIIKTIKPTTQFYYRDLIYYVKTQNPNIPNMKHETKTIFKSILQKGSQNHIIFGETQWKNKIINNDFSKIWKNTYYTYSQTHTKDLRYKLLHYATKTNNYICKISRDKTNLNPYCNYCHRIENNLHLFTTCSRIKDIWKYFQPIYNKLTEKHTHHKHIYSH